MKELGENSASDVLEDLMQSCNRYELHVRENKSTLYFDVAISFFLIVIGSGAALLVHPILVFVGQLLALSGCTLLAVSLIRYRKRGKKINDNWLEQSW